MVQAVILPCGPYIVSKSIFCVIGGFSVGINEGAEFYFWTDNAELSR